MSAFTEECPEVKEGVLSGAFKKKDTEALVDAYNLCMKNKTEARFEKRNTEAPAMTNTKSTPLSDEIRNLAVIAEESGDNELTSMLKDAAQKLEDGGNVPNYLKSAIQEHINKNTQLKEEIEVILKQL